MNDGSGSSSGTVFRALATALGTLRRSPGKDESWVESVLRTIERDHPERFNRMRRRLGLVQRLGGLAQLRVEEEAIATVGLFCYEIIGDRLTAAAAGGPWLDYLFRNERWLGPCLHACESLYAPTWEEIDSRPALIARFVVAYDGRTLEEHERPLQVIQALVESAQTEDGDRLGPLLWSEDGQELCDFHFRRHGDYQLDAKVVRRNLELLKRVLPAPATAAPASRAGPVRTPITTATRGRKPAEDDAAPVQASANFERRRQALRSTRAETAGEDHDPIRQDAPAAVLSDDFEEAPVAVAAQAPVPEPSGALEPRPSKARAAREDNELEQEEAMERSQMTALPAMDGGAINVTRRIETVRAQLDQIRRLAVDTQEMLADLAPQVEELATWVAELESVLNRRSAPRRAA